MSLLAIIIPYYKLTFFEDTLQSLANQIDKRFKVYIGDDASPENPIGLIENFKGQFDFIYHRFENNFGSTSLSKQWERCIELSGNEEWLMILGDDDVLANNVIQNFHTHLLEIKRKRVSVIRFATQIIDGFGNNIDKVHTHPQQEKASESFWRKYEGKSRSSLSEYFFKRNSYLQYGFKDYPLGWYSDDIAWLEFSNFQNIYSINDANVLIRVSEKSISGQSNNHLQKSQAAYMFYYTLSNKYLSHFSKQQRLKCIARVEREYFKNKSFSLFFKIIKWHLTKTDLFNLIKFIRRIYINF